MRARKFAGWQEIKARSGPETDDCAARAVRERRRAIHEWRQLNARLRELFRQDQSVTSMDTRGCKLDRSTRQGSGQIDVFNP